MSKTLAIFSLLSLSSCTKQAEMPPPESIKAPGNLPVLTESELAAEDAARKACVDKCISKKNEEAGIMVEGAEQECSEVCLQEHPIRQVEVVPDFPAGE